MDFFQTLDVRDTPVSDSDIQCFNVTGTLRELLLECPEDLRKCPDSPGAQNQPKNNDSDDDSSSDESADDVDLEDEDESMTKPWDKNDDEPIKTESEDEDNSLDDDSDDEDDDSKDSRTRGNQSQVIQVILQDGNLEQVNNDPLQDNNFQVREMNGIRYMFGVINGGGPEEILQRSIEERNAEIIHIGSHSIPPSRPNERIPPPNPDGAVEPEAPAFVPSTASLSLSVSVSLTKRSRSRARAAALAAGLSGLQRSLSAATRSSSYSRPSRSSSSSIPLPVVTATIPPSSVEQPGPSRSQDGAGPSNRQPEQPNQEAASGSNNQQQMPEVGFRLNHGTGTVTISRIANPNQPWVVVTDRRTSGDAENPHLRSHSIQSPFFKMF